VTAPQTFAEKRDATRWLATVEADMLRGGWVDPRRGAVTVAEYSWQWLDSRAGLAPRTKEMYSSMLRVHVLDEGNPRGLGATALGEVTSAQVRAWYATLSAGPSPSMAPKAYRLLRTILQTATDDELIVKNPAKLRGAGKEQTTERRIPTLPQLYDLADAVPERYRAMILTAGLVGLRFGELAGLTRRRVDLLHGVVQVSEQRVRLDSGEVVTTAPKSQAGRRKVSVPAVVVDELEHHLATFTAAGPDALVFTGPTGGPIDRTNFRQRVWLPALEATGVESLAFHDLRHLAGTLAAISGATTKELMARLGHASERASLIYQHATEDRDAAIAAAMSKMAEDATSGRVLPFRRADGG
jgi:integrase